MDLFIDRPWEMASGYRACLMQNATMTMCVYVCVAQIESLIAENYGHFMTNYLSYTTHNTNKTDTIIHVLLITQFHANYNFILSVRTVTFLLSLRIEQ